MTHYDVAQAVGGYRHVAPLGKAQRCCHHIAGLEGVVNGLMIVGIFPEQLGSRCAVPGRTHKARLTAHDMQPLEDFIIPATGQLAV